MSENNKSAERQNVSNEETEISGESQRHGKKKPTTTTTTTTTSTTPKSKKKKSLADRIVEDLMNSPKVDETIGEIRNPSSNLMFVNLAVGNSYGADDTIEVDYDEDEDDGQQILDDDENDGKGDGKEGIGEKSQTLLPETVQT